MNRPVARTLLSCTLATVVGTLFFSASAHAAITGINTPGTSNASIIFDDTNSSAPPAGITNTGPSTSPWNGTTISLPTTTDANTLDFASGSLDATFAGNSYAVNFSSVTLNQVAPNTGFALLNFAFEVEYQLDAAGLPLQPTLFPNFVVNGTVQNTALSFAALNGFIDYSGVNTAGAISVLETVNYNSVFTTPGNFSSIVTGVPVFGTTPVLAPFTTLTLTGSIVFQVDPASINAYSIQAPEPGLLILLGIGTGVAAIGGARRRRRPVA